MSISPDEAEESLAGILRITQRTRHSIADSGAYIFLVFTGIIWLVGFLANQFLTGNIVVYIWIGMSLLGSVLSILVGKRLGRRVRGNSSVIFGKRIGIFWGFLVLFCLAVISVVRPDGKQLTMVIILFMMFGQLAMGLVASFSATWWVLPIAALALAGFFWYRIISISGWQS